MIKIIFELKILIRFGVVGLYLNIQGVKPDEFNFQSFIQG